MRRLLGLIVVASLMAGATGCCAGPYRFWQNYIGWNNPEPDYFEPSDAPDTSPPGPVTPAAVLAPPTASST